MLGAQRADWEWKLYSGYFLDDAFQSRSIHLRGRIQLTSSAIATNSNGETNDSSFASIIMDIPPVLVLPQDLPPATVNQPNNSPVVFENSYGTDTYTASGLPSGLSHLRGDRIGERNPHSDRNF